MPAAAPAAAPAAPAAGGGNDAGGGAPGGGSCGIGVRLRWAGAELRIIDIIHDSPVAVPAIRGRGAGQQEAAASQDASTVRPLRRPPESPRRHASAPPPMTRMALTGRLSAEPPASPATAGPP